METPTQNTENKKVTIYSTPTCHFCHEAMEYLTKNNIPYEKIDVASDQEKLMHMMDISGQRGVPVIQIDNDIIIGFDKPMVAELLGLAA